MTAYAQNSPDFNRTSIHKQYTRHIYQQLKIFRSCQTDAENESKLRRSIEQFSISQFPNTIFTVTYFRCNLATNHVPQKTWTNLLCLTKNHSSIVIAIETIITARQRNGESYNWSVKSAACDRIVSRAKRYVLRDKSFSKIGRPMKASRASPNDLVSMIDDWPQRAETELRVPFRE